LLATGDSHLAGAVLLGGGGSTDTSAKVNILGGTDTALAGGGHLVLGITTSANISIDNRLRKGHH
jgi:hypothetical protein